jgi:hypothetical protein
VNKKDTLKIYWCPWTSLEKQYDKMLFDLVPVSLMSDLQKRRAKNPIIPKSNFLQPGDYQSCSALHTLSNNMFMIKTQLDAEIFLNNDGSIMPNSLNSNFFTERVSSLEDAFSVDFDLSYIFFSEDSVDMTLTPAYMHNTTHSEYGFIVPAKFDISSWIRPTPTIFQLWENVKTLKFKKNEPVSYITFDTGKKIEFVKFEMTPELETLAYEAATAVGCHWSGVDIMIDKETKKPYILEVNSSPGTEGISKVLGEPIVSKIVDYVTNKSNWSYYNLEVGYLENMEITGVGSLVAKFDTGNSSKSCSIHADKIEEKDGKLIWTLNGNTFVNDIVEYSKTQIGHVIHERPIIKINVIFNNVLVKNVKFSPTNRKNKTTPILINRSFMRRLGIVVNANKAFVITDEEETKNGQVQIAVDPLSLLPIGVTVPQVVFGKKL